ncbi:MAG: hypothetical protein JRF54_06250 [Deltaproteobacteria bacterium]|nr:hypothetical protein [Deltaproteobacteria bacterium]MBW2546902.1 hypothetical protein [Deltaproteobacteria bacterium]MBW2718900.1 hypothetical protein [Deltaproteobacteria bacterium]
MVELGPGDAAFIPAHTKHQVTWTTPDEPTVWLALFWTEPAARRPVGPISSQPPAVPWRRSPRPTGVSALHNRSQRQLQALLHPRPNPTFQYWRATRRLNLVLTSDFRMGPMG